MEGNIVESNNKNRKETRDKRREKVITNETCLKDDGPIAKKKKKDKKTAKNLKLINEYF